MIDNDATAPVETASSRSQQLAERLAFLRGDSPAPTWIGVGLIGLGFVVIAYTWGEVAALTSVPRQLPYFISGGLTAVALVLVGITVINLAAKRRDAIERDRQIEQLVETMAELRAAVEAQAKPAAESRLRARHSA